MTALASGHGPGRPGHAADPGPTPARSATDAAAGPLRITIGLAGLRFGGCQINAVDLASTLRAAGHAVQLFAVADPAVKHSVLPYAREADFEVELLPRRAGLLATARDIHQVAETHDADVVHVFAPWLAPPLSLASAGWVARAAVETNWDMENAFWGSPSLPLIVGTHDMAAEARSCRRAAVHLMEPPVDVRIDRPDPAAGAAFRRAHGLADDTPLAVAVSRLDRLMKSEGILQSVEAMRLATTDDLCLAIVGDGDAYQTIADAARRVNESLGRTAVFLTGSLIDPHPAYSAADVVLAMGGAALRGLAHEKAAVILGERGFFKLFEPEALDYFHEQGYYGLGEGHDPSTALAATLDALCASPARRRELGVLGREHVVARYSLAATTESLVEIYRGAVAELPSRPRRRAEAGRLLARSAASRAARPVRSLVRDVRERA